MTRAIKILCSLVIFGALLYSLLPLGAKLSAQRQTPVSLQSLRQVAKSLQILEIENGSLPNAYTWVKPAKKALGENLEDPTYRRLTNLNQPDFPGWGLNTRLNLPLGLPSPTSLQTKKTNEEPLVSQNMPKSTILVGPSFFPYLTPQTNGKLLKQPLSARNTTPTEHPLRLGSTPNKPGLAGLYLFADWRIERLTPKQAAEHLKLQHPIRRIIQTPPKSIKSEPPFWENAEPEGLNSYLARNETKTPLIPVSQPTLKKVRLRYKAKKATTFTIHLRFYNQHKQIINTTGSAIGTLTEIYAGQGEIKAKFKSTPPRIIGFQPHEGHLSNPTFLKSTLSLQPPETQPPNPNRRLTAHYQRGTPIGAYLPTHKKFPTSTIGGEWRTKTLITQKEIPAFTEFIELELQLPPGESLLVEDPKLILEKPSKKKEEERSESPNKSERKP